MKSGWTACHTRGITLGLFRAAVAKYCMYVPAASNRSDAAFREIVFHTIVLDATHVPFRHGVPQEPIFGRIDYDRETDRLRRDYSQRNVFAYRVAVRVQ